LGKINLLYLITGLRPYGGAEVALANLIPYIDQKKFDIWVGSMHAKEENEIDIKLPDERIKYFNFSPRYYLDVLGYWKLISFLKAHSIHILHTHLFAANTVGRVSAWLAGVPVTISTEHNTYFTKPASLIFTDKILSNLSTRIVAVSDAVLDHAARQANIARNRFINIPNCVPIDRIKPLTDSQKIKKLHELNIAPTRQIILSVGRLTKQKDFPLLIRAAKLVSTDCPDAIFLIAGKGELEDELQAQIRAADLQHHVRLLGYRNDIYDLMQISTMLVMSSLWEGLPVTLIEAGACGLPVVSTNVPGSMEIVQHGVNGLIVPMQDEKALADAIISMLETYDLRHEMGKKARQMAESRYSGPAVARKLESMYEELLASALKTPSK